MAGFFAAPLIGIIDSAALVGIAGASSYAAVYSNKCKTSKTTNILIAVACVLVAVIAFIAIVFSEGFAAEPVVIIESIGLIAAAAGLSFAAVYSKECGKSKATEIVAAIFCVFVAALSFVGTIL